MPQAELNGITVNYRLDGPDDGPVLVFANSLGTDLHMWDPLMSCLPDRYRVLRYDKRGHGGTSVPDPPYAMGALVRDAEVLIDHLGITSCVFVGLSVGGLIAQGLAAKRLDLVHAMVLSNTAARIGHAAMWRDRIDAVTQGGIAAIAEAILERWFSRDFRAGGDVDQWRHMLTRQPDAGYIGVSAAIAGTDFYASTSALRLPTLGIAGSEDGATPPDLVRETLRLVPGARFELMRRTGHLPCVEHPEAYARLLVSFLTDVGHR
ncbi:MAG: 3-oxoadipate enol-lactonase [Pseudomonadota bacterium]